MDGGLTLTRGRGEGEEPPPDEEEEEEEEKRRESSDARRCARKRSLSSLLAKIHTGIGIVFIERDIGLMGA